MNRAEAEKLIKDCINFYSDSDKAAVWDEYCDSYGRSDDAIVSMDDFIALHYDNTLYQVIDIITKGFDFLSRWAWMDGCGKWHSTDSLDDTAFYMQELVDYIVDNDESFGDGEIEAILNKYKEEEEEEDS